LYIIFCFINKAQQLYVQKSYGNVAGMSYKQEEIKLSKTFIKAINNKYSYKSDSTRAASIPKSNIKISIPHR